MFESALRDHIGKPLPGLTPFDSFAASLPEYNAVLRPYLRAEFSVFVKADRVSFFRSVCKFLLIPSRLRLPPHTRFRRKAAFNRRYRRHETGLATIYHRKKRRKRMFLPIYAIVKINSPRVCFRQFFVPLFLSPEAPDDTSDRALFYEAEKTYTSRALSPVIQLQALSRAANNGIKRRIFAENERLPPLPLCL